MSGTPGNVEVWSACDIFVATDLAATNPATISTPYNGSWLGFGFIDSDDGIEWSRDGDEKIIWAYGGFPVGMTNKNTLITAKFTAIENSPAVRAELWPGSSPGSIITPRPRYTKMGFDFLEQDTGKLRRYITANKAMIKVDGSFKMEEADATKIPFKTTFFPATSGELFVEQLAPTLVSIALTPLTLALTTGLNKFVNAIATYSDSSTADISDLGLWATSNATKATVVASSAGGVVSWVAAGSANISITYAGVTSTAPTVVTCS